VWRETMKSEQRDYSYLRPKKAKILKDWENKPFEKVQELDVWHGENATILPLKKLPGDTYLFGRAGVVDAEGNYVEMSAIPQRVQSAYPVEKPQYRDESVIYCGYWVKQWGHFLIESVARIWYAFESTEKLIFVTEDGADSQLFGNYKEFFQLLGVYDRIEIINTPTKFKKVLLPELAYKRSISYSDQYKTIFARIAENVPALDQNKVAEKIFLSRSHLKNVRKKEYGYDMLDNYFERNGYRIVHPQEISLSDLIGLLKSCSECASVSGTLPHNMLFAADYSKLTIIERNVLNNEIQLDINRIKRLNVTYVDACLAVYPVNVGYGPFVLAYNKQFDAFTQDRGYHLPDQKYRTKRYIKKGFVSYMNEYRRTYQSQWVMEEWMFGYCGYLYEAYKESLAYYGDYICERKPYRISHYVPWLWKLFVSKLCFIGNYFQPWFWKLLFRKFIQALTIFRNWILCSNKKG
jgi:hypothetical protein